MKKVHHLTIYQLKNVHKEIMKINQLIRGADSWLPFEEWLIKAVSEGV